MERYTCQLKACVGSGESELAAGEKGAILDLVCVQLFEEGEGRSIVVKKEEANNELLGVPEEDVLSVVKGILRESGDVYSS
jgi:hypothetical protein